MGKFPVTEIKRNINHYDVTLDIQGKLFLTFPVPLTSDVRIGDLLTIYTEVLVTPQRN